MFVYIASVVMANLKKNFIYASQAVIIITISMRAAEMYVCIMRVFTLRFVYRNTSVDRRFVDWGVGDPSGQVMQCYTCTLLSSL